MEITVFAGSLFQGLWSGWGEDRDNQQNLAKNDYNTDGDEDEDAGEEHNGYGNDDDDEDDDDDDDDDGDIQRRGGVRLVIHNRLGAPATAHLSFLYQPQPRVDICHKHHKQRLCKIVITWVKVYFVDVF